MLITLKKVYALYVFMYISILRVFVENYENLVAITLSLLITELIFQITRLGNISFSWDESKAWLFIHSQTFGVLYVAIEPLYHQNFLFFFTTTLLSLTPKKTTIYVIKSGICTGLLGSAFRLFCLERSCIRHCT